MHTHTHACTHTHTHTACRARGGCCCGGVRCRVGPLLGRGSLFLFHGLCFPLMMGPLSVLPVDLHHSGPLIKPPFTKPKRGNKEGKREKGERKAVMEVWKGKGDRKGKKQREAERVKGRKEWRREFWKAGFQELEFGKGKNRRITGLEWSISKSMKKKWELSCASLTDFSSADLRLAIRRTEALVSPVVSSPLDHTLRKSKAAHIQCALHDPGVFFHNCDSSLNFSKGSFVPPPFFFSELTSALHSHKTLLAAIQQNSAYIIMQIYLFIVCNHATEANMPFFIIFFLLGKSRGKE